MKSPALIVCLKEIVETARDRRTLGSLLIGPLVGPLLFVVLMNVMVSQSVSSIEDRLDVAMLGAEGAPNLLAYLRAREIYPLDVPDIKTVEDAADAVAAGKREFVLAVDGRYGEDFGSHPVGTGPYRLAFWKRSSKMVFARNPDYREEYFDAEPNADDARGQRILAMMKGRRMPMVSDWPDSPYYLLVCRKKQAPRCSVWPAFFTEPLPPIPPAPSICKGC